MDELVRISEQGKKADWLALNLLKKTTDQLDAMGFKDFFEEKTYSEFQGVFLISLDSE